MIALDRCPRHVSRHLKTANLTILTFVPNDLPQRPPFVGWTAITCGRHRGCEDFAVANPHQPALDICDSEVSAACCSRLARVFRLPTRKQVCSLPFMELGYPHAAKRGTLWTEADVKALIRMDAEGMPKVQVALALGRTYGSVAVKRTQLKQRAAAVQQWRLSLARKAWPPERRRAWTETEEAELIRLTESGLSSAAIALSLHRTLAAVEVRRSRLRSRSKFMLGR
jgi:hypothetical protein